MPASDSLIRRLQRQDGLNFWLTNRIPRRLLTTLIGRFSRVRSPWLTRISIRVWQAFADDLRLHEAEQEHFESLRDCFIRTLAPGSRPIDDGPEQLVSPCDAVIGAHGAIENGQLLQAKGMVYQLEDLLLDRPRAALHHGGTFVTLRLKSSMYHRFHAPCTGRIHDLRYISGDVYNVNPPTLQRIPDLFCLNERAVLPIEPAAGELGGPLTLVAVAAVLVASMRFSFLDPDYDPRSASVGRIACNADVARGQELGWFEHGSTIILLAGPGLRLADDLAEGEIVRMGRPLLTRR
jgi:phosphatidylserine decarboxylase